MSSAAMGGLLCPTNETLLEQMEQKRYRSFVGDKLWYIKAAFVNMIQSKGL